MKRILCILLSLMLTLTGLVGLCMTAQAYDTIEFGTYPQTHVWLTIPMKEAALAAQWKSYGYYTGTGEWADGKMAPGDFMQYADFFYKGEKYRAVTFSQYRPGYSGKESSVDESFQDENGYVPGNIYCFKYEPLKWRVLDFSAGLVMCENIIDAQAYNNYILESGSKFYGNASKDYYASNYYHSSIRKWLNEDFYNTAFNNAQKEKIKTTTLDNSAENADYSAPSSSDKIFLLSFHDATNTNYGFASSDETEDAARAAKGTDYAKCQGLWCHTSGNSMWLLRTPGSSWVSWLVITDGILRNREIFQTYYGIRPACVLTSLKADTALSYYLPSADKYDVTGASLSIKKNPTKTTYTYRKDTDLDLSGMEAELTFANGTKATLDPSECTVSGYSAKPAGTKTITVTYEGLTAQFNVTVKYSWWQQIIRFLLLGFLWY